MHLNFKNDFRYETNFSSMSILKELRLVSKDKKREKEEKQSIEFSSW